MPALVAALIATSGDEAFIMFSMIPGYALLLMFIIFTIAVIAGFTVKVFMKTNELEPHEHPHYHEDKKECICFEKSTLWAQTKNMIWQRAVILSTGFIFLLMIIFVGDGHEHLQVLNNTNSEIHEHHEHHEHDMHEDIHDRSHLYQSEHENHDNEKSSHESDWGWERITFLIVTLLGLAIIISVPNYFLKEHYGGML